MIGCVQKNYLKKKLVGDIIKSHLSSLETKSLNHKYKDKVDSTHPICSIILFDLKHFLSHTTVQNMLSCLYLQELLASCSAFFVYFKEAYVLFLFFFNLSSFYNLFEFIILQLIVLVICLVTMNYLI